MTENRLPIDDPRLTAYALGELDSAEQAEIEEWLARSPASRATVDDIRELAGLLSAGLQSEPAPQLTESQRAAILAEAGEGTWGGGMTRDGAPAAPRNSQATPLVNRHSDERPQPAPGDGIAARRKRSTRLASLVTMASMIVIAFLLVPARQPTLVSESGAARSSHPGYRNARPESKSAELAATLPADSSVTQFHDLMVTGPVDSLEADTRSEIKERAMRRKGEGAALSLEGAESVDSERFDLPATAHSVTSNGAVQSSPAERRSRDESLLAPAAADDAALDKSAPDSRAKLQSGKRLMAEQSPLPATAPLARKSGREALSESLKQSVSENAGGVVAAKGNPGAGEDGGRLSGDGPGSGRKPYGVRARQGQGGQEGFERLGRDTGLLPAREKSGDAAPQAARRFNLNSPARGESEARELKANSEHKFSLQQAQPPVVDAYSSQLSDIDAVKEVDEAASQTDARLKGWNGLVKREATDGLAVSPDGHYVATRGGDGTVRLWSLPADRSLFESEAALDFSRAIPDGEAYDPITENPFVTAASQPLSTFGVDVDTASYTNVRKFLIDRRLPPRDAVRIEEFVNYFRYDDPRPADNQPFSVRVEVGRAPWQPEHRLVRIGLKGREIDRDRRPLSNLVFLVDVSGSMAAENKLPLVKAGLSLLTNNLGEGDRVAIVTYSDTAVERLKSTPGDQKQPILDTINALQAGGSTNGAGGIQLAYDTAARHFIEGGTNRVILCTDGDFNVGVTSDDALVQLIQERARGNVFFSVFGFGMGNLKDGKLEKLADNGNGNYAYIGDQREAKKVFVDELSGTLVTIAKDVKIQVEFNPARVGAYRLLGYENRALVPQDFHNDKKDAGEIGAGHSVTALYEILPADRWPQPPAAEALRYRRPNLPLEGELGQELLLVKLRYKQPEGDQSALVEVPVKDTLPGPHDAEDVRRRLAEQPPSRPSRDFEWSAAVAAFGMVLRDSQFRGQAGLDLVLELAQGAKGEDANGLRQEFIELVQMTKALRPDLATPGVAAASAGESPADQPATPASAEEAQRRATVGGKYRNLLRVLPAEEDLGLYGAFHEFGPWQGTSYRGHSNLPQGHWVYVAPHWYIWGDLVPEAERPSQDKPR
ncbi:MAG: von Willebrand factor type A domain-containing protein [Planctomycetales bacterium]